MKRILDLNSKFIIKNRVYYYINTYIPCNLDIIYLINNNLDGNLRDILLKKSPIFPHQQNLLKALCLLINKICWLQFTKEYTDHGYFNYDATQFRRDVGLNGKNFTKILKILEELNVLKRNHNYSNYENNKHSKSFKFTSQYAFQKPKLFEPRFIVTERETIKFLPQLSVLSKVEEFLHSNLKELCLAPPKENLLEIVRKSSKKRKIDKKIEMAEIYIDSIKSEKKVIGENGWIFTRSKLNGRISTSVTMLKRELRQHLTFKNQNLVELDQHASQPFLLLKLYSFLDSDAARKERDFYYSLFSNNFYESFAGLSGDKKQTKCIKKQFINVLNSKPEAIEDFDRATKSAKLQIVRTFRKFFPILWCEIINLKTLPNYRNSTSSPKGYHTQFAYYLQRLESRIFIDSICAELMNRNIFCYTIHDGIGCLQSDSNLVKEIMEIEIEKEIGFKPIIKQK